MSAAAAWLNMTFAGFDFMVFKAMHDLFLSAGWLLTPVSRFMSFLGEAGWFEIVLALVLTSLRRSRRVGLAMVMALVVGTLATDVVIKHLICRPRPFVDQAGQYYRWYVELGSQYAAGYSFPSGHTTAAMAAMGTLFAYYDRRYSWTALLFVALMGLARMYLYVHYPTDVVMGIIVGTAAVIIAWYVNKALRKWCRGHAGSRLGRFVLAGGAENVQG